VPLCPPQTPHAAKTRTRAVAVGSQRLTARATARAFYDISPMWKELRTLGYESRTDVLLNNTGTDQGVASWCTSATARLQNLSTSLLAPWCPIKQKLIHHLRKQDGAQVASRSHWQKVSPPPVPRSSRLETSIRRNEILLKHSTFLENTLLFYGYTVNAVA
jgi:hypothetical protein